MLKVEVKKSIDSALKILKRKFIETKTLEELRERQSYKKKSVSRREKLTKAKYKEFKRLKDTD